MRSDRVDEKDGTIKLRPAETWSSRTEAPEPTRPLDFLYPKSTYALLRSRPVPNSRLQSCPGATSATHGQRCLYTSLATNRFYNDTSQFDTAVRNGEEHRSLEDANGDKPWSTNLVPLKDIYKVDGDNRGGDAIDKVVQNATDEASRARQDGPGLRAELEHLLSDQEGHRFHNVWDAYCSLKPAEQAEFRPRVVVYLARSQSIVEAGRSKSLIHLVDPQQWDNDFLSAAVLLSLRTKEDRSAVKLFKQGVRERGLVGGFEYLLLDAVNRQQWSGILDVWEFYYEHGTSRDDKGDRIVDQRLLDPLGSLPSLGALYFGLERFLSMDGARKVRVLSSDPIASGALDVFRRRFAKEALRQGCPPRQAAVILEFWRESALYNQYLVLMLNKWYKKTISDSSARELLPVYHKFRKLEGAKIWPAVLKGIFQIHYPAGEAELEKLYEDWLNYCGELSQWAFEKFMKFYASKGDTVRVRQLWDRCAELYPASIQRPAGFRSTLNVCAQNADVDGAEEEFRRMTEDYKVEPDLSSWNLLLKCYSRAGDDGKTADLFDRICAVMQPNSFTYAHIMAMASRKGDLDQTLKYFHDAQNRRVPLTQEIALSIIVAYCKNDQLAKAEEICFELAEQGITSTAAWNQLINLNGMKGQLKKCYKLLHKMKEYNLEWDSQIISSLLRALVQVKQIYPAYDIVRDHAKSRSHILHPDHFNIVLGGAVRTHNRHITESLMLLMKEARIPTSFNAQVAYTEGTVRTAPNTLREGGSGADLVASLEALASTPRDARRRREETSRLGQAVRILVELREFDKVEALLTRFEEMVPQGEEVLPSDVTAALMLAYIRDGNHARVHELWNKSWPRILKRSSRPEGQGIYPAYEFDLSTMVFHMACTFAAQRNGKGLLNMVEEVTEAGFKFTSSTWDVIIRSLARLGQWERAMDFCETLLMPNWKGWDSQKIPHWRDKTVDKNERRQIQRWEQTNTRQLRPTVEAVLALEEQWLKARRLAAWSEETARKIQSMEHSHPLLRNAFMTSRWVDGWGPYILKSRGDLSTAMVSLLSPLPIAELRWMRRTLESLLGGKANKAALGVSPQDRFRRRGTGGGRPTPLRESELKLLKRVLSKNLSERSKLGQEGAAP